MTIEGGCHCGNIRMRLEWPEAGGEIPVRECGCTFCRKHAGAWTSHPEAALEATLADPAHVSLYEFGTETAEFHVCSRCGAVPLVTSAIEGRLHAVVNVNTLEGVDPTAFRRSATDFDGEDATVRLERRKRGWIPNVRVRRRARR